MNMDLNILTDTELENINGGSSPEFQYRSRINRKWNYANKKYCIAYYQKS